MNGNAQPRPVRVPDTPLATASTTTEDIASRKAGDGRPDIGTNPLNGPLDRVRVDDSKRELATNQGVKVVDNQDSLKIGLRGPTALDDFIFREKITHFDHERIPERVVHARGAGAHGYLLKEGAQPRIVGQRLGELPPATGEPLDVEVTFEATPSVMYDGIVIAPGEASAVALARDARVLDFVRDQYRHGKPLMAIGAGNRLLSAAGGLITARMGAAVL